jgi:integrase
MRTLFAVGVYCGLRLGDAARLDWGCVDLVRRVVRVAPAKTARRANGMVVSIPLHPSLLAILSDTPPANVEAIFTGVHSL